MVRIAHRRSGPLNIPERIILDHEFVLIRAGSGRLRRRDAAVPFAAGDLLFIEPFVPHAFESDGDVDHVAVHFDFAPAALGEGDDLAGRKPYEVRLSRDLRLPPRSRWRLHDATPRRLCDLVRSARRRTRWTSSTRAPGSCW